MGPSFLDVEVNEKHRQESDRWSLPVNLPWKGQWRLLVAALILCDGLMLFAALQLSFYIRFYASLPIFRLDVVPDESTYRFLPLVLIPLWLVVFAITGLYNHLVIIGGAREDSQVFTSSSIVLFLILASEFFVPGWTVARGWLLVAWIGSVVLTITGRFAMRRLVRRLRRNGLFLSPALIVGANPEGQVLADQLSREQFSGLQIVGFVDDEPASEAGVVQSMQALGTLDDIDRLIAQYRIEELILASSAISQAQLLDLFQKYGVSRGVNLRMSSGLYQIIATGFEVAEFANVPLIGIKRIRLTGLNWAMKLFVDYCLTVLAVLILSPLLVLIGVLVRLDSRGPVIYRRRVMGVNGRQFDAFKFRTMIDGADKFLDLQPGLMREFQMNHKLKADPRITRFGGFLRKTSLDELPQLFNVLRGEMSLVGPRMISPEEMAKYQQAGINLLTVKPGITGLWQVNGRSDVSYEERVKMDLYYIRNWSIFLDLHLLLRTIPAILSQQGAY